MYTELLKIIEGGLAKDPAKVVSYSKLLADNLDSEGGDRRLASRIREVLSSSSRKGLVGLDELAPPVDQESRMSIVDIERPSELGVDIMLPPQVQFQIEHFLNAVQHRSRLIEHGVEADATLLLYGPPGCGKTSLAHLVASRVGLPLLTARFDSLISPLLGNTAKNIRKIFDYAEGRPCVLFLDEFDAIAKARDDQFELGELKRVINSLLQNIDQYAKGGNMLIAATNHPELLDRAIWRRFSTIIELGKPLPDLILRLLHAFILFPNDILSNSKHLKSAVELLSDRSPADIKAICHKAVAAAVMANESKLDYEQLLLAYYQHMHHSSHDPKELANFLHEHGIPKTKIPKLIGESDRQTRYHFQKQ